MLKRQTYFLDGTFQTVKFFHVFSFVSKLDDSHNVDLKAKRAKSSEKSSDQLFGLCWRIDSNLYTTATPLYLTKLEVFAVFC